MYASCWNAALDQLAVVAFDEDGKSNIYLYPGGSREDRTRLETRHTRDVDVALPHISPDGRLVAFSAQRGSQPWQIVIQPLDDPDAQTWFTEGRKPVWNPRPSDPAVPELFFISGRALYKACVRSGKRLEWLDERCVLPEIPWLWEYQENPSYAITPTADSVLMIEPRADEFDVRRIKVALGVAREFFDMR
jgi:hypothetical protein